MKVSDDFLEQVHTICEVKNWTDKEIEITKMVCQFVDRGFGEQEIIKALQENVEKIVFGNLKDEDDLNGKQLIDGKLMGYYSSFSRKMVIGYNNKKDSSFESTFRHEFGHAMYQKREKKELFSEEAKEFAMNKLGAISKKEFEEEGYVELISRESKLGYYSKKSFCKLKMLSSGSYIVAQNYMGLIQGLLKDDNLFNQLINDGDGLVEDKIKNKINNEYGSNTYETIQKFGEDIRLFIEYPENEKTFETIREIATENISKIDDDIDNVISSYKSFVEEIKKTQEKRRQRLLEVELILDSNDEKDENEKQKLMFSIYKSKIKSIENSNLDEENKLIQLVNCDKDYEEKTPEFILYCKKYYADYNNLAIEVSNNDIKQKKELALHEVNLLYNAKQLIPIMINAIEGKTLEGLVLELNDFVITKLKDKVERSNADLELVLEQLRSYAINDLACVIDSNNRLRNYKVEELYLYIEKILEDKSQQNHNKEI